MSFRAFLNILPCSSLYRPQQSDEWLEISVNAFDKLDAKLLDIFYSPLFDESREDEPGTAPETELVLPKRVPFQDPGALNFECTDIAEAVSLDRPSGFAHHYSPVEDPFEHLSKPIDTGAYTIRLLNHNKTIAIFQSPYKEDGINGNPVYSLELDDGKYKLDVKSRNSQLGTLIKVESSNGDFIRIHAVPGMAWVTIEYKGPFEGMIGGGSKRRHFWFNEKAYMVNFLDIHGQTADLLVAEGNAAGLEFVQIMPLPGKKLEGQFERDVDYSIGSWPTDMTLAGSSNSRKTIYSIDLFTTRARGVPDNSPTLHYIPASLSPDPGYNSPTALLSNSSKFGPMKALLSEGFQYSINNANIGFIPFEEGDDSEETLGIIYRSIARDIEDDNFLNMDSGYTLTRGAQSCIVLDSIIQDKELASTCLKKLKIAFRTFQDAISLKYDPVAKTLVLDNMDFANKMNTLSQFVYSAAVISKMDLGWQASNKEFVNAIVRDINNPSNEDKYFVQSRLFDWFSQKSRLANQVKGASRDYRDINIFSAWTRKGTPFDEIAGDVFFVYACRLWGAVHNRCLAAYASIQLNLIL